MQIYSREKYDEISKEQGGHQENRDGQKETWAAEQETAQEDSTSRQIKLPPLDLSVLPPNEHTNQTLGYTEHLQKHRKELTIPTNKAIFYHQAVKTYPVYTIQFLKCQKA